MNPGDHGLPIKPKKKEPLPLPAVRFGRPFPNNTSGDILEISLRISVNTIRQSITPVASSTGAAAQEHGRTP